MYRFQKIHVFTCFKLNTHPAAFNTFLYTALPYITKWICGKQDRQKSNPETDKTIQLCGTHELSGKMR
jgi:hypothetical protein